MAPGTVLKLKENNDWLGPLEKKGTIAVKRGNGKNRIDFPYPF